MSFVCQDTADEWPISIQKGACIVVNDVLEYGKNVLELSGIAGKARDVGCAKFMQTGIVIIAFVNQERKKFLSVSAAICDTEFGKVAAFVSSDSDKRAASGNEAHQTQRISDECAHARILTCSGRWQRKAAVCVPCVCAICFLHCTIFCSQGISIALVSRIFFRSAVASGSMAAAVGWWLHSALAGTPISASAALPSLRRTLRCECCNSSYGRLERARGTGDGC
jgi:hypothetical protein